MNDDELRTELASWVHEVVTQPAPNVGVLRRRARSRLLRRIASACAVLVVIVGIGLSVNAGLVSTRVRMACTRSNISASLL